MNDALPYQVIGYTVLRILSERNGSWVYLAINSQNRHCCLKIQRLAHPPAVDSMAENRSLLSSLCAEIAFIGLTCWGIDRAESIVWEELELADDAITGRPFSAVDVEHYTPLTLAAYVREHGPIPTRVLVQWAIGLTEALATLHQAGLYHRDLKPANLLLCRGKCVIADYGSVGAAGSSIEFPGTEGYVPPDGMGSPALDVFALGRTLYEAWTGLDRFQFPSLPQHVVEAQDWQTHGWQLNQILNSAAEKRPSHRIPSAERLLTRLKTAQTPRRRFSRRQLIGGTAAMVALGVGTYIWKSIPPFVAVWKHLPPQRFGIEGWRGNGLTVDWKRNLFYSASSDVRGTFVTPYDLRRWGRKRELQFPKTFLLGCQLLIEDGAALLTIERVTGQCYRLDLSSQQMRTMEVADLNDSTFGYSCYFSRSSQRIGSFCGYGNFTASNWRHELNLKDHRWEKVSELGIVPWARTESVYFSDNKNDAFYVFGGNGNQSGKEGELVRGLKDFNGRYYPLRDLWRLNHESNRWSRLFDVQSWAQKNVQHGIFHTEIGLPFILSGSAANSVNEGQFHIWEGEEGKVPRTLPNQGERIAMFKCWSLLQEPESQDMWVFADEGVFAVTMRKN